MIDQSDKRPAPSPKNLPIFPMTSSIARESNLKKTESILKAARLGDLQMLRDLCTAGYSLLSRDETGKTVLHYGARFGHKEVIKFLLAQAPPYLLDMIDYEKGQTALHKAAAYGLPTICCLLVNGGANLSVQDVQGKTACELAENAGDHYLSAYLESQEEHQANKETQYIETYV